ncbi:MAG TPA: OmpA family protein [Allosphingosinicella sp.]|nr:OmpA family protein [Allosphingosinicella sp.]
MRKLLLIGTGLAAALAAYTVPASAQDRWDWDRGDSDYRLVGPGVPQLYRELRGTERGRAFVMRNFDFNRDGRINRREAEAANSAFATAAGSRRDRFDWDSRGRGRIVERDDRDDRDVRGQGEGGWDRQAMRSYNFRQTPQGARMTMQEDVLFATDSDVLRPAAIERLRPLAGYLRANPGVRVAIDGHTDSRGTDAHNQDLSERRAQSVREALDDMGVTRARFRVAGHGESNPTATNATPEGMRLNRRVEVTLLGRRADEF